MSKNCLDSVIVYPPAVMKRSRPLSSPRSPGRTSELLVAFDSALTQVSGKNPSVIFGATESRMEPERLVN